MMRTFALFFLATSALVLSCLPQATAFEQPELATVGASKENPPSVAAVASNAADKRSSVRNGIHDTLAANHAIQNQKEDDRELTLDFILAFFSGATSDNILALIADLRAISLGGTSCANEMSTTRVSLISVVDPLELVVSNLVDLTVQVLSLLDPIIDILQEVLEAAATIFGQPVVDALNAIISLDALLQSLEPIIQGFAQAMGLGFDVLRATVEGLFSVSGLVQGAASIAGLSADVAQTAVNCCQTLTPFDFICEYLLDAFATNPLIVPIVQLARDAVQLCPTALQQALSIFPDFEILSSLNDALGTVVNVTEPLVAALAAVFDESSNKQDLCCTGSPEMQREFRDSLANKYSGLNGCELAGPVIDATNHLRNEVLPKFTTDENNLRQQPEPMTFILPLVDFANGVIEGGMSCTLGSDWTVSYDTMDYTVEFPALDFTGNLTEPLNVTDTTRVCNPNTLKESWNGSCCLP